MINVTWRQYCHTQCLLKQVHRMTVKAWPSVWSQFDWAIDTSESSRARAVVVIHQNDACSAVAARITGTRRNYKTRSSRIDKLACAPLLWTKLWGCGQSSPPKDRNGKHRTPKGTSLRGLAFAEPPCAHFARRFWLWMCWLLMSTN